MSSVLRSGLSMAICSDTGDFTFPVVRRTVEPAGRFVRIPEAHKILAALVVAGQPVFSRDRFTWPPGRHDQWRIGRGVFLSV